MASQRDSRRLPCAKAREGRRSMLVAARPLQQRPKSTLAREWDLQQVALGRNLDFLQEAILVVKVFLGCAGAAENSEFTFSMSPLKIYGRVVSIMMRGAVSA